MSETIFEFEKERPSVLKMRDAAKSVGGWDDDPIPVVLAANGVRHYPTKPEGVSDDELADALETAVGERPTVR